MSRLARLDCDRNEVINTANRKNVINEDDAREALELAQNLIKYRASQKIPVVAIIPLQPGWLPKSYELRHPHTGNVVKLKVYHARAVLETDTDFFFGSFKEMMEEVEIYKTVKGYVLFEV